jgi:arylformamidase
MKFYDVTLTISNEMPTWPGDPVVHLRRIHDMANGDKVTLSQLDFGVHTGTHVDAPVHFVQGGSGVDTLSLDTLIGMCEVRRAPNEVKSITAEVLDSLHIPFGTIRLLVRTSNSDIWARGENKFQEDFVAIEESGAKWIVEHGIKLVGVDYLSVGSFTNGIPTHNVLLGAGVIPIEGLNLSQIEPGEYLLYCLPLKLKDADGAPARVVLIH